MRSAGSTREFQFQTVSADSIERIEVTKSPTPDLDGDSIGGAVNLVTKSAFDGSPERRIRGSIGAIWRSTDPRDKARAGASLSYSEVFGGRIGVSVNLAYRPHGSIIDVNPGHRNCRSMRPVRPTPTWSPFRILTTSVRVPAPAPSSTSLSDTALLRELAVQQTSRTHENSQVTRGWPGGSPPRRGGNSPAPAASSRVIRTMRRRFVLSRPVPSRYWRRRPKQGTTSTLNVGGVHRHPTWLLDYDVYSSKSKAYYAGNNDFTYTIRNIGFTIRKDDVLFPTVTQTAGADWTRLESYTDNLYASARSVGWDAYEGGVINLKKQFTTPVPTYRKAGLRLRTQTRDLDNTPYRTVYVAGRRDGSELRPGAATTTISRNSAC